MAWRATLVHCLRYQMDRLERCREFKIRRLTTSPISEKFYFDQNNKPQKTKPRCRSPLCKTHLFVSVRGMRTPNLIDLVLSLRWIVWCPFGVQREPNMSPKQRNGRKERRLRSRLFYLTYPSCLKTILGT
jgi:hypothetical protein